MLNKLKVTGGPTPIYTPLGDLTQRSFHRNFHVCTDQGCFLKNFLTNNELGIN
jgi:hypothetical protein